MLHISPDNSAERLLPPGPWSCLDRNPLPAGNRMLRTWLLSVLAVALVILFLPWRQNIQSTGTVTTLDPSDRPQTIQATIAGRIEQWYVREGELVRAGDTIVHLSEVKTEYFDTSLVTRTQNQVAAKTAGIAAYEQKAAALAQQIVAMEQELALKREQLAAKVAQTELKLASLRAEKEQAAVALNIAQLQFDRTDTLFQTGVKSRTEWEDKRQKLQEAQAKMVAADNKVGEAERELEVARLALLNVVNEYNNKIAKAESDRFSTLSDLYAAQGELNKLEIQYENYAQRREFYYILAPQDCYITQALKPGIGETVKEGDPIVSIMPANFELAVSIYVKPMDLPLIHQGEEVRFIFDGWPAIVFTGWPELSFGTYSGTIVGIDNNIGENGTYRVLVGPNPNDRPWPDALRPGSGARGVALLNQRPVWYELWRQLNGFPPDYYAKDGKQEEAKMKAPLKSVK
ncbi:MAG: HlyD family efflux transporter periplasmic adaptor subunit [Lewinella sp.]|nr:HlyD family efflux transporter periplasmic adaptor subunit [Lewinella sp.]